MRPAGNFDESTTHEHVFNSNAMRSMKGTSCDPRIKLLKFTIGIVRLQVSVIK